MSGTNRTVAVELQAKVGGFVSGFRTASRAAGDFNRKLLDGSNKHTQALNDLSMGAGITGAALLGIGVAAIKTFAEFDKAMSGVAAATHAPQGEIDKLRALALKLGADTKYSATEAADGITQLAKAGVSTKDIIGGGLAGALSLAAAGEIGVGDAAEIAATALTQFKLQGKDLPHVADLLAAGAGKAQGSVSDMSMALKQSGLVASQMGLSVEETTGTLAAFASAGLIGSDAGTSFRTMLLRLANPTAESADLMKQLGIHAYDASGNFVGMSNLAGQLKGSLGGLTQAQRDQTLATIFGSDAIRAANVLYTQGSSGIDGWTSKVDDAGYAAWQAAKQMDNLVGDLERLRGAVETALTNMGQGANGPLRDLVQSVTDLVDGFNKLPKAVQSASLFGVVVAGGALLGVAAVAKLLVMVNSARDAVTELGIAGTRAGLLLRSAFVVGAVLAVATALDHVRQNMQGVKVDAADLQRTLRAWGQTGKASGATAKLLGDNMKWLDESLQHLVDPSVPMWFSNLGDKIYPLAGPLDDSRKRFEQLDRAMANMVEGGDAKGAAAVMKQITEEAKRQGKSVDEVKKQFPEYAAAVKNAADATTDEGAAAQDAADYTDNLGQKASDTAQQVADLEQKVSDLVDELNGLSDVNLDVFNSQIAVNNGLRDMTDKVKQNGTSLRENTKAGDANRAMLLDQIQKIKDNADAVFEKTKKDKGAEAAVLAWNDSVATNVRRLYDQARHLGLSREATRKLIAQVLGIPESAVTKYTAPGLAAELQKAQELDGKANRLDGRNVRMSWTSVFTEKHIKQTIEQKIRRLPGSGFNATGGLIDLDTPGGVKYRGGKARGGSVVGPGSGTSDTAGLFALSNGEFVNNARSTAEWLPALRAINDGLRPSDLVRGSRQAYAAGLGVGGGGDTYVDVYLGDRQITDIVRVEVREHNRNTKRRVTARAGGAR